MSIQSLARAHRGCSPSSLYVRPSLPSARRYSSPPISSAVKSTSSSGANPTSKHRPGGQGDRLSFFPFLLLFLASSGSYLLLVKKRTGQSNTVSSESRRKAHTER